MVKRRLFVLLIPLAAALHAQNSFNMSDLRSHNKPTDCWLAIHGTVYDVTKYVPQHHKFDFDIAPYCGTDATKFWDQKPESGDSHSRKAEMLLRKYKIGTLSK